MAGKGVAGKPGSGRAKSAKAKVGKAKPAKAKVAKAKVGKAGASKAKAGASKAKAGAAKAPAKKAPAKKAPAKASTKAGATGKAIDPSSMFMLGVDLAQRGFVFDAMAAFRDAAKRAPKHELADDALVNIGVCSLRLGLFADAVDAFTRVIEEFPDATIAEADAGEEHGRTAAKALFGRVRAKAGLGDFAGARADAAALAAYDDSYAVDPTSGERTTFHALAERFLNGIGVDGA
jgi:tetratricopeptide (TPR) repeat protein